MQYFRLDPLADYGRGEFCFTDDTPNGIATSWFRLAKGEPLEASYPSDQEQVTLKLGDDYPGLRLPSFIGNTAGMLIVNRPTAAVIQEARIGKVECLPFVLLDHKGRAHSNDYVFLNPLERIAALNLEQSEVRRSRKGEIKDVTKMVLDARKVELFLDLFRLAEDSTFYLFSEQLVTALKEAGATNFAFVPVETR